MGANRAARVLTIVGWLMVALVAGHPTEGQNQNAWSPRQRIPGIHNDSGTPYLVADRNRTVHAFYSQPGRANASDVVIVYNRWTLRDGWTMPADIILPPQRAQASILDAFLDGRGMMHLVFFSGDDAEADLFYAWVWASVADDPQAWSIPKLIGEAAIVPRTAALVGDEHGNLTAVYSGTRRGVGLYSVHSSDGGDTWSETEPFFLVDRDDLRPWADNDPRAWAPKMVRDGAGRLHVTWVVVGRDGNGKAIFYTGKDAGAKEWEAPQLMATVKPKQYEVDWPSIVAYHDDLLLIHNDIDRSPILRMMHRSKDGGRTWREPVAVWTPTAGEYGTASFAVDGGDNLHAVYGDRARGLNLWHSVWDGDRWGESEPIAPATEAQTFRIGPEEYHPAQPRIVASQGNVLLAAWRTDPGRTRNGPWFAYKRLDLPEWPVEPLPPAPFQVTWQQIIAAALIVAFVSAAAVRVKFRRVRARASGETG